jgi:hypothetical protein
MAEQLTQMIPAKKVDLGGFRLAFEVRGVPVQFANAIRRILLDETPVVEISEVVIHENTTLMPHEMLKLRTELLPVNVRPTEEELIREARLTLRVETDESAEKKVYTSDFTVANGRSDVLMTDRDLKTPLYLLKLKPSQTVHLTAGLRVNPTSSHVCVASYAYHIDPELAERNREAFEGPPELFDSFYIQRSYHRNEKGRPDWFDFVVESIGVVPAREIVKDALSILKKNVIEWTTNDLIREKEDNVYQVVTDKGGITVTALVQAILYESGLVDFVAHDHVYHPLRPERYVRFLTTRQPEEVLRYVATTVAGYCDKCIEEL